MRPMRFSAVRLAALLIAAFVLGGLCYKFYDDFHDPAAVYISPADVSSWLAGEWTVDDLAGATHGTQIDKATALALVGTMADFKKDTFTFDDMSCPTAFHESIEQPVAFFEDYGTMPFMLHMHMPNTRIDAGCAALYPFAHDTIFISYEGYFLEAVRRPATFAP